MAEKKKPTRVCVNHQYLIINYYQEAWRSGRTELRVSLAMVVIMRFPPRVTASAHTSASSRQQQEQGTVATVVIALLTVFSPCA